MQYPTKPQNCDLASLQKSSQHLSQNAPKSIPKCTKIDPKLDPKSIQNGLWYHLRPTWLPRQIFDRFCGPVWMTKILLKSIVKSKHFRASPRNSFYTIRAPKKLQNYIQNVLQNQPFSQEDQILKILLSPRRGPSFRGLDTLKISFFFLTCFTTSLKPVLATHFYQLFTKMVPRRVPQIEPKS